jgi:hypothetical protein
VWVNKIRENSKAQAYDYDGGQRFYNSNSKRLWVTETSIKINDEDKNFKQKALKCKIINKQNTNGIRPNNK